MAGGNGGSGGGAGGTVGQPGGNAAFPGGGGGGGAGASGGTGTGGARGGDGGTNGSFGAAVGGNGGNGFSSLGFGAGGGGEGGFGFIADSSILSVEAFSDVYSGGNGGRGGSGAASVPGSAADGGDGGVGFYTTNPVDFIIRSASVVEGGDGGQGGFDADGTLSDATKVGLGGDGGSAIAMLAGGLVQNEGQITGGNGGVTPGGVLTTGSGGAGIFGQNLTVTNIGTITGGVSGDTSVQADAITFTGGANTLVLGSGATQGTLNGGIGITGSLTLDAGGNLRTVSNVIHDVTTAGSVEVTGLGVTLDGANTYSGSTSVTGLNSGLIIGSSGSILNSKVITVGTGARFVIQSGNQIAADAAVTLDGSDSRFITGGSAEVGSLNSTASDATIIIGGAASTLTTGRNGTTEEYRGFILGGDASFEKSGAGVFTLSGDGQYSNTTIVSAGTLRIDGSTIAASTTVANAATLGGAGLIRGSVSVDAGGTIGASAAGFADGVGSSAGQLTTGSLTLASGAIFQAEFDGAAGTSYDQIQVNGTVNLGGATLDASASNSFVPAVGQSYVLISNDGADAVSGTFAGLAEGSTVTIGGVATTISYRGGDGNDVTLSVPVPPPAGGGGGGPTNGPDNLVGTLGNDTIAGGFGNDTVSGLAGNDELQGNQGNDLVLGNQGNDTLYGGQDNDTVYGGQDDDLAFGNKGDDIVYGNLGNDAVYGNEGNDTVLGNEGSDTVHGGQGDDYVHGGMGDDMVFGGIGNDQVWGGQGNDTLSGGEGADTFLFAANSGNDIIVDFNQAEGDRLDFQGQTFTVSEANGSTVFDLSGGGTIVLQGVSPASLGDVFLV